MALDGVELVMAIEEEFGIDIPDSDAEKMVLVGDVFEYLKKRIEGSDPNVCLSQRVFYKLRLALIENYGLERRVVEPGTRLSELLSYNDIKDGWPYMKLFIDLKTPPYKVANEFLGLKLADESLTLRQLVASLIQLNRANLPVQHDTVEGIWERLVQVFVRQLNVSPEDVRPEASISQDLGCD